MASKTKRYPRTKSSKRYCAEKFACNGERVEADFECEQCKSVQCADCERDLHKQSTFHCHDREVIPPPPLDKLCCAPLCNDRNYVDTIKYQVSSKYQDFHCEKCNMNFCEPCYDKQHNTTAIRKKHRKIPINLLAPKELSEEATLSDEAFTDASNYSPVKTSLPFPDSECSTDTLTFHSFPQTQTQSDTSLEAKLASAAIQDNYSGSTSQADNIPENDMMSAADLQKPQKQDSAIARAPSSKSAVKPDGHGKSRKSGRDSHNKTHDIDDEKMKDCESFCLVDNEEILQVQSGEVFLERLKCDRNTPVKVLSIFGNTGDGKSHTLNHTFFEGREIFKTSPSQTSCTIGVWATYDPRRKIIILDTEGLLGVSANENQRTRLLLKVFAVSDIILYRTKAQRLPRDMFQFLGDASEAYMKHFSTELEAASKRLNISLNQMGPDVIIFHETQHTEPLGSEAYKFLEERFRELRLTKKAFHSILYEGTQTNSPPTRFDGLRSNVEKQLDNLNVRSPRKPDIVFKALQVLNEKFCGKIENSLSCTFPEEYFTCVDKCLSCNRRCKETMNHSQSDTPHSTGFKCIYQHQFDNKVFLCKKCHSEGRQEIVIPKTSSSQDNSWLGLAKFAWSGYVLECPRCGIIYRSREHWYGNLDPTQKVVHTEYRHIWEGDNTMLQGTHNAARKLLDGFHYLSDTITSVSAKPAKAVGNWMSDQIAPPYWRPNSEITKCHKCKNPFDDVDTIHHCRKCGEGFCDEHSSHRKAVPEHGWGLEPVRVCDDCYENDGPCNSSASGHSGSDIDPSHLVARKIGETLTSSAGAVANLIHVPLEPPQIQARKVSEALGSTLSYVKSAVDMPLDMIRDTARPAYWKPDQEIKECTVCSSPFGPKLRVHHCRCCGDGVCDPCSQAQREVPSRGWDYPVRVCKLCYDKKGCL